MAVFFFSFFSLFCDDLLLLHGKKGKDERQPSLFSLPPSVILVSLVIVVFFFPFLSFFSRSIFSSSPLFSFFSCFSLLFVVLMCVSVSVSVSVPCY